MEPTLVVVGLNHRTAAVEVRERFWMSGCRQAEVLSMLSQAEGIEEVLVFSTCNRTEFVVWGDATLAVNSILRLLTAEYDLKLQEWNSFYRLLDEQALAHCLRVSCGLDSMCIGEEQIVRQVTQAWSQARNAGCTGRFLNTTLRKSLSVRRRVHKLTPLGSHFVSAPFAALQLADQLFGSVAAKNVVLLGAGRMGEITARELFTRGAKSVCIVNRTYSRAQELAGRFPEPPGAFRACAFEKLEKCLLKADLVISATASPRVSFTAGDMSRLVADRLGRRLVLIDLGLPRNIDPAVRVFDGVLLYDLEDLERAVEPRIGTRAGEPEAEKIVLGEVREFRKKLVAGGAAPEVTALRLRIDEISRLELESFRLERGPFPKDQDRLIAAVTARITSKIACSLSRDLRAIPEPRGPKGMIAGA
ncbi:MAG: glutamyl-tRNA reductase [Terriglobales bacterium]